MKKYITTALAAGALFSSASALTLVTEDITVDTTWDLAGAPYILTDVISVKNGAVLTIDPGVIVRGEPKTANAFDPGTLVVTRKSQIEAAGTVAAPIIFTTSVVTDAAFDYSTGVGSTAAEVTAATNAYAAATFLDADPANAPLDPGAGFSTTPGDTTHLANEYRGLWGGVIILGCAPTNIGVVANGEYSETNANARNDLDDPFEGFIEGLDPNDTLDNDGVYGGTNPNDSSGTLRFVSIRHGGTNLAANNEINGLTMGGVGFGTCIEFVEVYCNNDDGFEWFGGTVNTRFLVSLYNNDDSFDIDEGFTGLGQFWFSLQLDDGVNGDHGGEHDGTNGNFDNVNISSINGVAQGTGDEGAGIPVTFATVYNATYHSSGTPDQMLKFEDSFGGNYFNSVFAGAANQLINAQGTNMQPRIDAGDCEWVSCSIFYDINGNTGPLTPADLSDNVTMQGIIGSIANGNRFDGTNPVPGFYDVNGARAGVNPRAIASPADLKPVTCTFFIPAGYVGAFDPTDANNLWTDNWSVFSANVSQ